MASMLSSMAGRCAKALLANGCPVKLLEVAQARCFLLAGGRFQQYGAPAETDYGHRPPTYEELVGQLDNIDFRVALDNAVYEKVRNETRQRDHELSMRNQEVVSLRKQFDQEIFRRDRMLEEANRQIMIKSGWWNMKGIMEIWAQQNNDSHDWKGMLQHHDDLLGRIKARTNWDDETTFQHVEKMFNVINDPYQEKLQTSPHDVDIIQGPVNRQEALALSAIALHVRVRHRLYLAPHDD